MAKKSNAAKIRAYMTAHPDAKPADVAAKFNVKIAYVYVIRSKMKKVVAKVTPEGRTFKWVNAAVVSSDHSVDALSSIPTAPDMVNHPPHYKTGGIETIDFIEAKKLNYHLGNVVKYVTRADHKGDRLENLQKAKWYLEREIAHCAQ